ncbi:MAG TPA: penicillin acylase family protein [Amycolatopsis sp.]|uniref:penicillin acylase family protein n=1 Tax=Amycolatopsis sp. TaxID=37632 RepID=UPI002B4627F4|nr:penicillin acylase family protein [Amycolatopsis sp.]HKS47980.1 penicillin acylase family protein [Amycolatopsis sp.]
MAGRARRVTATLVAAVTAVTAGVSIPAQADQVTDYCLGQCNDILPPGENGNATLADILANKLFGTRPAHTDDQLATYGTLANDYQSLTNATIDRFFTKAAFGVPPDQVESTSKPRSDVTVVRDKLGIPHVTGTTRAGTEFGAGYVAAQDRLWLMDVFRHVGRGQLSGFAGGASANRELEQTFWAAAPYTEQDLQNQVNVIAGSGPAGTQALADINAYLDGINTYLNQAYQGRYFPGEYVLTGHVDAITNAGSIAPFTATDLIAIASVVGALFGTGGGGEVQSALVRQAAQARYGITTGDQVWQSFREENDPEAVPTIHNGQNFPYAAGPANPQGVAMPDPGSVTRQQEIYDPTGSAADSSATSAAGVLPGNLLSARHGMSNALVVSGRYTDDGHPIAVFGPQTGYFAPQLLMLEELRGPGISARGVSFAGTNFYVQLGRGPDYSWSATSAGQDITDTFAVPLCRPDGSTPAKDTNYYLYNGQCTAMETLEVKDSWRPTVADGTAAGSYRLVVYRTKYGLVTHRATIGGKPVAYTSQRSTYQHEAASIVGFQMFNNPDDMATAGKFMESASNINYTFNWFYVNSTETAYFNSGWNPVRSSNVDPNLPVWNQYEWQNWNPGAFTSDYTPVSAHPNSVDQDYYVSWNNKQALDYSSAGFGEAGVHRVNLLDSRLKALVTSGRKISRADVVKAMEDAAVTDLRGEDVLPTLLRVINSQPVTDSAQAALVSKLRTWLAHGAKRVETAQGSKKYVDADAIRLMDAWWPLLAQAEFQPGMGDDLFTAMIGALQINESPSGGQTGPSAGAAGANQSVKHKGSSFQYGWWSYVDKDLRAALGQSVSGGLARKYCGDGSLTECRSALLTSLGQAAAQPASTVYPADDSCSAGDQWCADSIIHRPMGGITDPSIAWQNRPTYQQVVQFASHR